MSTWQKAYNLSGSNATIAYALKIIMSFIMQCNFPFCYLRDI